MASARTCMTAFVCACGRVPSRACMTAGCARLCEAVALLEGAAPLLDEETTYRAVPLLNGAEGGGADGRYENRKGAADSTTHSWGDEERSAMRQERNGALVRCYFLTRMVQHLE
jgi:hypothetical protein